MKKYMTKEQAIKLFKNEHDLSGMSKLDKVLYWSDFTDFLQKQGEIRETQYNNWSNPFEYRNN